MLNLKINEFPTVSFLSGEDEDEASPSPKENLTMADYGLTPEIEAAILAAGAAVGAAKEAAKPKAERKSLTSAAWAAAKAGTMPAPLSFPASNAHAQKHADRLLALAQAEDRDGLAAYQIGGTNTYSKALRSYREALLAYLAAPITLPPVPAEPDTSDIAEATEAMFKAAKVARKKPAPKAAAPAKPKPKKKDAA